MATAVFIVTDPVKRIYLEIPGTRGFASNH